MFVEISGGYWPTNPGPGAARQTVTASMIHVSPAPTQEPCNYGESGLRRLPLREGRTSASIRHRGIRMEALAVILNQPELKLSELLVPWIVVIGLLGFLAAWLVAAIMERTGLSRHVWHLPLFFLGLVILFSSLFGLFFLP